MLSVGVLRDVDDGEKLLDLASGISKLTIAVILLIIPLSCLDGQLVDLEHELFALAVERFAISHEGQPVLLEGGSLLAGRCHELNEGGELALGLSSQVRGHPAAVVGQEGALPARATARNKARGAVLHCPGASNNTVRTRCPSSSSSSEKGGTTSKLWQAASLRASILLVIQCLKLEGGQLVWRDIHTSLEEASGDAALVDIALNHCGVDVSVRKGR